MSVKVYFDTSALAKWYLNEARSADVERYIRRAAPVAVSSLTDVEMRCLLARRRREGGFDARMENKVYAAFKEDMDRGFLARFSLDDTAAAGAVTVAAMLPEIPLRTLDALHLALARNIGAEILATADRTMAAAAAALELDVVTFWPRSS